MNAQTQGAIRGVSESRMVDPAQQNAGGARRNYPESQEVYYDPAPLTEYPRMMYKATTEKKTQEFADAVADMKDKPFVINDFGGLLCDTKIANDASEAEQLIADGWDISPQAAHGQKSAVATAATAKDDEIARLQAELAAMRAGSGAEQPAEKRGPGRPRLTQAE